MARVLLRDQNAHTLPEPSLRPTQRKKRTLTSSMPFPPLPPPFRWLCVPSDTASVYKNESELGRALRCAGVPRESVFITTKLSPYEHGYAFGALRTRVVGAHLGPWLLHVALLKAPRGQDQDTGSALSLGVPRALFSRFKRFQASLKLLVT